MLIKIRDEINMTIGSYQELFESIIAHGIRKALLASIVLHIPVASERRRVDVISVDIIDGLPFVSPRD